MWDDKVTLYNGVHYHTDTVWDFAGAFSVGTRHTAAVPVL